VSGSSDSQGSATDGAACTGGRLGLLRFPKFTQYSHSIHSYSHTIRKLFANYSQTVRTILKLFANVLIRVRALFTQIRKLFTEFRHQFTAVNTRYLYSSIVLRSAVRAAQAATDFDEPCLSAEVEREKAPGTFSQVFFVWPKLEKVLKQKVLKPVRAVAVRATTVRRRPAHRSRVL
jgi:hypothetical protein